MSQIPIRNLDQQIACEVSIFWFKYTTVNVAVNFEFLKLFGIFIKFENLKLLNKLI